MKKKKVVAFGFLILTILIYLYYPNPLLLIVCSALATLLFIKSDFFARFKKADKANVVKATKTKRSQQKNK